MNDGPNAAPRVTRRGALRAAGGAAAAGGAGVAGALIGAGAAHEARADVPGQEIVGSWYNPQTRGGGVAIATFAADGSWSNVHPDRQRSPAKGSWVRAGERTFHVTRWSLRFNERDELIGTMRTRAEAVVDPDGDALVSRRISELFDLDGNVERVSPLIQSRSTRIKPEGPRVEP